MGSTEEISGVDEKAQEGQGLDFIRAIVAKDLQSGKHQGRIATRFPPEPNGYLHIGHAKSICLNFGVALENNGVCHLRFDDSNPAKEDIEYVESIKRDVKWLGFDWGQHEYYASDYFEKMYGYAEELIKKGKAYVCSLTPEQVRDYRGTLTQPGKNSPYRERSVDENLDLFRRMRAGEFKEGEHILRAKIDMASGNLNMRDPALYRVKHAEHHRTGNDWCIYPMYDFCHCISDALEYITHSLCTLEFEDHRPLYDWILDEITIDCHPQQIEFARLNITNTVLSKRKLLQLVQGKFVSGWDDPRMPTLAGMRRRGYTPAAIRAFCDKVGIAKANSTVEKELLEFCLREDLNLHAQRRMAVLRPLKVIITNFPEGQVEELEAENNPEREGDGRRKILFTRELFIEQDDFKEDPPKKWFRLAPGMEVRLKHAYYVRFENVVKNEQGECIEVHCSYDPKTKGGWSDDGRKVKGTLHWVSAAHAVSAEVRLYDELILDREESEDDEDLDFTARLNPNSLEVIKDCKVEPSLQAAEPGEVFQFLRLGYFCVDSGDSTPNIPVFNRTVGLRDSWAKIEKKL